MKGLDRVANDFDAKVKTLLARKDVLANVLIYLIDEFKGYTFEQVLSFINEDDIKIGSSNVDDLSRGILTNNIDTEDSSADEGTRRYDVKFRVRTPVETYIYINIEAQKNANPGYSLVKRAFYYMSRLISSQYNIEFTNSNFNNLKKVYSIWLCTDVHGPRSNTIVSYSMEPTLKVGNTKAIVPKDEYDMGTIEMLYLNPDKSTDDDILNMFRLLLHDICDKSKTNDVLDKLYQDYHLYNLKEESNTMCNMSEYWKERGIEEERKNNINNMHHSGLSSNQIAEILKLDIDVVEQYLITDTPNSADETNLFDD